MALAAQPISIPLSNRTKFVDLNAENLCAVISTFTTSEKAISNIAAITAQVSITYVVDDSGNPDNNNFVKSQLSRFENVRVIANERNIGLASSLNRAIDLACSNDCKWIIVFDDDTSVTPDAIDNLVRVIHTYDQDLSLKSKSIFALSRPEHFNAALSENVLVEREVVITSGSLFSSELYQALNGYDEGFFIDLLDFDFSLRAKYFGGRVFTLNKSDLHHTVGNPNYKTLFSKNILISNHAPFRYYYHYRNAILFAYKHIVKNPIFVLKLFAGLSLKFLKMLLFEDRKLSKIKYTTSGILHGLIRRQGKLS